MNKCKNCKWFNNPKPMKNMHEIVPPGTKFGICKQLHSQTADTHIFVPYNDVLQIVGENFGCNLFEVVKTEYIC